MLPPLFRRGRGRLSLVLLLFLALPSSAKKPGKELHGLLLSYMQVEDIHPDSLEANIADLKKKRLQTTDEASRAVYAAAIGRLYAERIGWRSVGNNMRDSSALWYGKALKKPSVLADVKAKHWKPFVVIGKDEGYFRGDMLNVVWRSLVGSFAKSERDTMRILPKYKDIIAFYRARGQREAAFLLALDSLEEVSNWNATEQPLLRIRDDYADLPLCAEVYLRLATSVDTTVFQQRTWLQQGISRYPKYKRKAALQNALTRLSDPFLVWEGETSVYPGKQYLWKFRARNMQSVRYGGKEHSFAHHDPIETFTDSIIWTAPSSGDYELTFLPRTGTKVTQKVEPIKQKFCVSALQMLYQLMPDDQVRMLVVDADSGRPQQGVTITAYQPDDTLAYFSGKTDKDGRLTVPRYRTKTGALHGQIRYRMSRPDEQHLPISTLYVYYSKGKWSGAPTDSTRTIRLYTDRAIYRPGQTVHLGGIVYDQLDWDAHVARGKVYTVELLDANYKSIETRKLTTDDMGVLSSEFVLPTSGKNGTYQFRIKGKTSVMFRVEEYKRPTFEVTLEDSLYIQGDSVIVRGKAMNYDGSPLRSARVTGTYTWQTPWLYVGKRYPRSETLPLDTIETDDKGRFSYVFGVKSEELKIKTYRRSLSVNVDVLSQQGETHNASYWYWRVREIPPKPEPVRVDSTFIVRCVADTFAVGKPGRIEVTTNLHEVCLHYTLSAAGQVWKDTMVVVDHETFGLDIPYDPKYDQSLTVSFAFVKNERIYTDTKVIRLAMPDNRLKMRWDTFRDLLQPGQREEWKLTLLRPDGTPAEANLMVAMYDASLDYFARHGWSFGVNRSHRTYGIPFHTTSRPGNDGHVSAWYSQKTKKERPITFSEIDGSLFDLRVYSMPLYSSGEGRLLLREAVPVMAMAKTSVNNYASLTEEDAMSDALQGKIAGLDLAETEESAEEEVETMAVPMRENFDETAFFYPTLRTDNKGQVSIAFTLPESLTRWHMLGIAHTADLYLLNLSEEVEAKKDLMAQLYLPRFLRPGDETELTATVRNESDRLQRGKGVLQVIDAQSGKVLKQWKTNVELTGMQDTVFHFPYKATESDIVVKWAVEGADCSDGEQRLLPVLPATIHVTNTMQITAYEPRVEIYDLSKLFPEECTDRQLTLEYTTHPEQYALQTLPTLAKAKNKDVLSLASAYYAGMLGKVLGVAMPDSTDIYLQRMKDLQDADGGFRWYPSMPTSPYLTREVSYLLTRLKMLTGDAQMSNSQWPMVNEKAVHYLLAQRIDSTYFGISDLRNLYVALWSGVSLSKAEQKKVDFLLKLAKKAEPEEMSYESQALLALVWHKDGEQRKARKCADLFRKRLVSSPDRGTYIEFPKGSFVSIDRKLHIHVQLMETLSRVMPDSVNLMRGMCRYLLQQKRTQEWSTPINSANAIFALLNNQNISSAQDTPQLRDLLTLTRKGMTISNFTAKDDTLGYLRDSMDIDATHLPVKLRLQKFSKGESWGGVYADFEQPFAQVETHTTGLSVRIEYSEGMKKGNRYKVRYHLSADRDYEYVSLIVPRPATAEPVNQRSGYGWSRASQGWWGGLGYYRQVHDATTEFNFHQIPRGDYLIEEEIYIERDGLYHSGVATICCTYAEEFQGHSNDSIIEVRSEK